MLFKIHRESESVNIQNLLVYCLLFYVIFTLLFSYFIYVTCLQDICSICKEIIPLFAPEDGHVGPKYVELNK